MIPPQIGQRWMVDTDSSLGLGIVTQCDARSLTLDFPAIEESRRYSCENSPLTRVVFAQGDTIETITGDSYVIAQVESVNGLVIYLTADGEPIPETRLAATVDFNNPVKRLLAGQLDKPKWFDLRAELAKGHHQWWRSDVVGLQGARITLTPHQLYVADTATSLATTRILLADEVGLGKTIEAGLILQRLLLQERVQRVLILVPDALRVQWFVELVRCFNIHAVMWGEAVDLSEAHVFIAAHTTLEDDVLFTESPWDMVIVDEAHHFDLLSDTANSAALHTLGSESQHLLLLSATPERMGLEQHFSRLQLLDPCRFHDFTDFQQQYADYETLADDLAQLVDSEAQGALIPVALQKKLQALFPHLSDSYFQEHVNDTEELIGLLLDCHGTGRVVFRNTRSAMKGFPQRKLIVHTTDHTVTDNTVTDNTVIDNDSEPANQDLLWLAQFIQQANNEKILFITHDKDDVLEIREWLYRKTGIDCPIFHEGMSLIERDRAAAYFADEDEGAPMLLCSEIGSEGRNFQFCNHLICWDLPEHPDVLEQRIGRLDRIGQQHTINIHVCLSTPAAELRLHWYHDILNCIEKTNPAAGVIHEQWYVEYVEDPITIGEQVKQHTKSLLEQLQNGRDRLLEMNSCRQPQATALLDKVIAFEEEHNPKTLLIAATDLLNIHMEPLDSSRYSVIPSDQMLVPLVPGIPMDGCEITFERTTATAREDVQFITWDHPLMQGLTDLITTSELGVASVALLPNKALKAGTLFVEAVFTLTVQDTQAKAANAFLTDSLVRVVVTKNNPKNLDSVLPQAALAKVIENAAKNIRKAVVKDYQQDIQDLAANAQAIAEGEFASIIKQSLADLAQRSHFEHARLEQLQQRNPLISEVDVDRQKQRFSAIEQAISQHCQLEMSAVRVLVSYKPEKA
ncbi:MAG: ATP-dependent helicase HepA [Kiritimatiellia bacterium]|jgi:ATP-dependent helicase HepA